MFIIPLFQFTFEMYVTIKILNIRVPPKILLLLLVVGALYSRNHQSSPIPPLDKLDALRPQEGQGSAQRLAQIVTGQTLEPNLLTSSLLFFCSLRETWKAGLHDSAFPWQETPPVGVGPALPGNW